MGIDNHLKVIKEGVFGRDVRQAIHDGIQQVYEDATAEHGNENMEVAKARGYADTLADRLDQMELADKSTARDVSVVSGQIDNLIANVGNGTVPSELIDLRVARSGRQYLTAGEAIRKQFEEVNMNLSELQNNILLKWNPGFVRTAGTINTTNTDWNRSDYIGISDYSTVSLTGTFPSLGVGLHVAFFDQNKQFLSGITDANKEVIYQYQILPIPANANYMILTTQTKNIGTVSLTGMVKISAIVREFASSRLDTKIVVAQDGSGDYATLTDAVANAKDGDRIYVKSGNYSTEHVEGWGKSLTIEGENPLTTIISCSDSTYERPAMEFSVGVLRNLTIKRAQGSTGGYALHVEDSNLYGKTLTIDNCILITEGGGSALGMGMYGNCKILLKDSKFITNSGYAALYFHDSNHEETKGLYDVEINNCYFETKSEHVVKLQSQEIVGSTVNMTWVNNTFYTVTKATSIDTVNYRGGLSTNPEDFAGLINWRLRRNSHGNTMAVFNRLEVN
ncbi:TPA: hypothetical protein TXL48_002198 [Streptococcus suis]|nr:hypothetical protein [Streptococcus suis]